MRGYAKRQSTVAIIVLTNRAAAVLSSGKIIQKKKKSAMVNTGKPPQLAGTTRMDTSSGEVNDGNANSSLGENDVQLLPANLR